MHENFILVEHLNKYSPKLDNDFNKQNEITEETRGHINEHDSVIKQCIDKYTSPSPSHSMLSSSTTFSFTRERNLESELESLQEKLKDTEERLQSLRLQHDTLSQAHRTLRDTQSQYLEESERLKLDVQHLNECANILRSELKSARADRAESLQLQTILYKELDESRTEKKKAQDQSDRDGKTIQDLQRQCKEMERILMRKHPDSVSALIGIYYIFKYIHNF